jgi:DNA-binding response OmpR family regulator
MPQFRYSGDPKGWQQVRENTQPGMTIAQTIHGMKKRILLVDDDRAVRESLGRVLTMEDYLVLPAADGIEALKMAAATQLDLVILDLNMPRQSGWDTFEHLTRKHPLLPVIIITARSGQLFTSLGAGVAALLEKPLDMARLITTIEAVLTESDEEKLKRLAGRTAEFHYAPPLESK